MTFGAPQIAALEKRYRTNLINSLSGFKGINLIGTTNGEVNNLAPFSSVVHIGAHPPLQGMISRPDSVERHTLENIRKTGFFTINQVHEEILEQAHRCSARFPREMSEFDANGLRAQFINDFPSPYVLESRLKFGLELKEIIPITHNGTYFVIGQVVEIHLNEEILEVDGHIDHITAETLAVTALDTYAKPSSSIRLPYQHATDIKHVSSPPGNQNDPLPEQS